MDRTELLSRVLGVFLAITGAATLLRWRYFMSFVPDFVAERTTRMFMAIVQLLAGLFLVIAHNRWSPLPAAIVTVLGWVAVLEGTLYLTLPDQQVRKFIGFFNRKSWYVFGGVLSMLLGVYLAISGFA